MSNIIKQTPPITRNLIIINILVLLFEYVTSQNNIIDLNKWFGLHFVLASDFHWWQLITYLFLHAGFTHLFFNMFALWMFGVVIERTLGFKKFLIYYFVCGIGAGLCQELWQLGQFFYEGLQNYPYGSINQYINAWTTIGASGACYGVLLAFGFIYPNEKILLLIPPIPLKAKYFVFGYALIELFSVFLSDGNIAHFAHLGGMLFGWFLLVYWKRKAASERDFQGWENFKPKKATFWEKTKQYFFRKKVQKEESHMTFHHNADYEYNIRKQEKEKRLDEILDKVKACGYDSLTSEEKKELFRNSQN